MPNISRRMVLIAMGGFLSFCEYASANVVPITCGDVTPDNCAIRIKAILTDTTTSPEQALQAWGAWSDVYENAYRGMADAPAPPSDLDRFEDAVADKIDSYTNPTSIALDQAIARFFPKLAAVSAYAEGPAAVAIMTFLAPSPTVTPIQELQATNNDLASALAIKLFASLRGGWRQEFNNTILNSLNEIRLGSRP
ncbi:hypothetical protein ACC689_29035 [Rhizobium ruizarguesonis]